jgi:hypothetical protein
LNVDPPPEEVRPSRERIYADWFVWTKRNLSSTTEICHAAAEAATEATERGEDPIAAARKAGQSRSGPGWTTSAQPDVKAYAEWFDWARTQLGVGPEDQHRAAQAAIEAERAGADAGGAANAARAAVGQAQAPAAPPPSPPPAPYAPVPPPVSAVPPPPGPAPYYQPQPPPPQPYAPYPPLYPPPAASQPVPVWASIFLMVGAIIYLLIGLLYVIIYFNAPDRDTQLGSAIFIILAAIIVVPSIVGLIGLFMNTLWGKVVATLASILMCLTCVGLIFGGPALFGIWGRRIA